MVYRSTLQDIIASALKNYYFLRPDNTGIVLYAIHNGFYIIAIAGASQIKVIQKGRVYFAQKVECVPTCRLFEISKIRGVYLMHGGCSQI